MSEIELNFELENEILEWSEEFNINNYALFALIEILKKRSFSTEFMNNKKSKCDQETQIDLDEYLLNDNDKINNNYNIKSYLEDLKQTQKVILNEITIMRNESNSKQNNISTNIILNKKPKKLLDFPIKSLKHFQQLENISEKNYKLRLKLINIFLSNTQYQDFITIDDFVKRNIEKILNENLISHFASCLHNAIQLEEYLVFKCLTDASSKKFANHKRDIILKSIFDCLKKLQGKEEIEITSKISKREYYDESRYSNIPEEHFASNLELVSLEMFFDLPCNSIKDLLNFEEQCKEIDNITMHSFFKSIPKTNYKTLINIIMNKVLGKKIVNNIAWEDKTASKTEIKDFKFIETLTDFIMRNFEKVIWEDIIEVITQWLKEEQEKTNLKHSIKLEVNNDIIELEINESPVFNNNEIIKGNESDEEMCTYNEEFLEEDDENFYNLLPYKTKSSFHKFDEICRSDFNYENKLRQLFQSQNYLNVMIDEKENPLNETKNLKEYIESNFHKVATTEVIANLLTIDKKSEFDENINYADIYVLKILHECIQEKFPNLCDDVIKKRVEAFIEKTKETYKNWNLTIKSQECRIKLQNIQTQEIITPECHSIHLQRVLNLPINNFDAFQDFNKKCLSDSEMSMNLMTMFLQVTETDCNKFVDKNLRKLITENMSSKITWNGIQDNIAVKDFHIMKLLIDAAKKNFPHESEEAIIESIKLALRRFKDRIRKRKSTIPMDDLDNDVIGASNDEEEIRSDNELLEIDNDVINLKKIPCRTIEEFKNLEKYCRKCKDLQINLKELFDTNSNNVDPVKFISESLKRIVVDSVLGHFSYNGLKNNIRVKYYTVIRTLMDSLIVKYPFLSEEDVIKTLRKALQLAKDRKRSILKKKRKRKY